MRNLALSLIFSALASVAAADDTALSMFETGNDSRGWEAVGRLDVSGAGFCTGALIGVDLVLTAAHCVYGADGRVIDAGEFQFLAGLRDGRAEAYRGVRLVVPHPDYVHTDVSPMSDEVSHDLAVLQLDQPIRTTRIQPFEIAPRPGRGGEVGIVSYARDRAESPSLQEVCEVLGQQSGVMVMSCDVNYGSSGSPVFAFEGGVARIVSVVSSMADLDERRVALGTELERPLAEILAIVESSSHGLSTGANRVVLSGERTETGAKFLRP